MIIETRDFGRIEVEDSSVFDFPEGVYGFEHQRSLVLYVHTFDDIPFLYLQSINDTLPCFLVFEPKDMFPSFSPDIESGDLIALGASAAEDLTFLLIANVSDTVEGMSLNVKCPIALNSSTKKGRQVILQNPDYSLRYQPFAAGEGESI